MWAICKRLLYIGVFCQGLVAVCLAADAESEDFVTASSVTTSLQISLSSSSEPVQYSTVPIGSWFVRHVADQLNEDVKMLSKMEKRGFSRSEIITLVILSKQTEKPLKDFAKERLKDQPSLRSMAERSGLDYSELYKVVQTLKKDIEEKGETDLPPPVFEVLPSSEKKIKQSKKKKKSESTTLGEKSKP